MKFLFFTFASLGIAGFFSGFGAASMGALLYLYYVYDTGITFTGLVIADWMLFIAFSGFTYTFSRDAWRLKRAVFAAIEEYRKNGKEDP